MASISLMGFTNLLLVFNLGAAAMGRGYIGPTPTSGDLVGIQIQSMAPRPTRPPSMDENTGELRKRLTDGIPYSWCAFIEGDSDDPITCSSTASCVFAREGSFTSLWCSPLGDIREPNIYTSCIGSINYALLPTFPSSDTTSCPRSLSPYCQIATFSRGEYVFYCDTTTQRSTLSLEYLSDGTSPGSTTTITDPPGITTPPPAPPPPPSPTPPAPPPSGGGLAAPAIAGIGVAVGVVIVGAIAGLAICLCLRRRKRKEGANQPVEVPTGPSKPPMQQGNSGQGWQTVAPASSPYPNSQTAFLKNPEQPSPPYSSEPGSIYNTHSPSLSSPVMPYDSISRTGSIGLYPLSQNPSATGPPNSTIPPSAMPSVHKPGELPRFNYSSNHTAQPPSPILRVGHHGEETGLGSPSDNQVHEIAAGFLSSNNPRGSVTSQSPPYQEISTSVVSPTRQSSGNQSPPPLQPIHEAPQAYYNENQAHDIVSSHTSRQSGPGAYYEATRPPQEMSAGGGGGGGGSYSYSNSIGSNIGHPNPHDMMPPTPTGPAVVVPTSIINSGTYEGQQQAQSDSHEAPATRYLAYSPGASPVTSSPPDVYHNDNAQ